MSKTAQIQHININGLNGRLLRVNAKGAQKQTILLVYGMHSSIERMKSTAEFLSRYGEVVLPDLPGIGGMESFYKLGMEPTLDNYADYLYSVMRVFKLNKKVRVVGMSFGFLVVTRMFKRHPDSIKWVKDVISFVGFGRSEDFKDLAHKRRYYTPLCNVFSTKWGSRFVGAAIFNRVVLKLMFAVFRTFNPKYQQGDPEHRRQAQAMETQLWQANDARTRFYLYRLIFYFDLTKGDKIKLPLHNLTTPVDQYFSHKRVATSLKKVYARVSESHANLELHAPSVIGDEFTVENIFSDEAKRWLAGGKV